MSKFIKISILIPIAFLIGFLAACGTEDGDHNLKKPITEQLEAAGLGDKHAYSEEEYQEQAVELCEMRTWMEHDEVVEWLYFDKVSDVYSPAARDIYLDVMEANQCPTYRESFAEKVNQ